jgi:hypothetical protein
MNPTELLRADFIGIKQFRHNIASLIKSNRPKIVTDHGKPRQVLIAFDRFVELIELLEDFRDRHLLSQIVRARKAYQKGRVVPLARLAKDLGLAA